MKVLTRSLVFAVVVLLTWMLTAGLRAQSPSPNGAMPYPPPETTATSLMSDNGQDQTAMTQSMSKSFTVVNQNPPGIHMTGFDAFALDGQAVIAANLSMRVNVNAPPQNYVWHVRILDASAKKVLDQHLYDDQMFQTNPDGTLTASFGDIVPLPPGQSRVQLRLYSLPVGANTMFLLEGNNNQPFVVLQKNKNLVN